MKKEEMRAKLRELAYNYENQCAQTAKERRRIEALETELANIKTNWRPVPITHEWQPRNPQCALCDEPRDSARHQAERNVVPGP